MVTVRQAAANWQQNRLWLLEVLGAVTMEEMGRRYQRNLEALGIIRPVTATMRAISTPDDPAASSVRVLAQGMRP